MDKRLERLVCLPQGPSTAGCNAVTVRRSRRSGIYLGRRGRTRTL